MWQLGASSNKSGVILTQSKNKVVQKFRNIPNPPESVGMVLAVAMIGGTLFVAFVMAAMYIYVTIDQRHF